MQYSGDCVNYQVNALVCHMFCIKIMQLNAIQLSVQCISLHFCIKIMQLNAILWCLCQLSVQCISLLFCIKIMQLNAILW